MLIDPEFDKFLTRVVKAMEPYLSQLVLVGGCASALYKHHGASSPSLRAMMTRDVDVAGQDRLEASTEARPLAELLAAEGLKAESASEGKPPAVKYVPVEGPAGLDLEFLCPLRGRSDGGRTARASGIEIQDGLVAQPLRYLDLLLINPWEVDLAGTGLPGLSGNSLPVRVANPVSYLVQKILIRDRPRSVDAKRKDCYYIYELSVTFREAVDRLAGDFELLKQQMHQRWIRRFRRVFADVFRDASAEGPTSAVVVHQGSPDHVREAGNKGFLVNTESVYRSVEGLFPVFGM